MRADVHAAPAVAVADAAPLPAPQQATAPAAGTTDVPAPQMATEAQPAPVVSHAMPAEPPVAPPEADNVAVQPAREAPAAIAPMQSPVAATVAPPVASAPSPATALATANATIIFANLPGARCGSCETLKISVTSSGQVLMERGYWTGDHSKWSYKRTVAHVGAERAAAFAASLSADRPSGARLLDGGIACMAAVQDDGLAVEWIEAERHDRLTVKYTCPAGRNTPVAERLRRAPDLLGLRGVVFPEDGGR